MNIKTLSEITISFMITMTICIGFYACSEADAKKLEVIRCINGDNSFQAYQDCAE